jgi:uncharacterized membrane protein
MNEAHLHLALNHLPIVIPIVGISVMVSGLLLTSELLKRAAYFIFIGGAITAFAAFSSGEGAEEIIEGLKDVEKPIIKLHEETAETFSMLMYVVGGISLIGVWINWKKKSFSKALSFITLAFAVTALLYGFQTGTTGGEIRHPEIRLEGWNDQKKLD